ncbi:MULTISPECIES: bifunctional 2-polyprenyl-6-hydroxyphenol methylase/3-demethylubiquinol 3-O-methyltransferase UbiG [unclassified Thioalkalivibrio]|uniref:class I SAM-dependent methyltransferase n=1 Tax=unclassified Thioalkalivibrio TaxID=2621013 RepID=UPI0003794332|nr:MULTISPECIES: class I SAM-dependent methyltransferase [unclassified Thioalkalivibrio]
MRSAIYDLLILRLTARWYAEALERMPDGARVLDVGIGTAGALLANAERARHKQLHLTGIDIDGDYVRRARRRLQESTLADCAAVFRESVYDHAGGPYDVVYFSASFMLLPDPEQALRHCKGLLAPGGRFLFTQTIQRHPARWVEILKPLLLRITTIDFGHVTYEADLRAQLAAADLVVEEWSVLATHGSRASCLVVACPASEGAGSGNGLARQDHVVDAHGS